MVKANAYGHGCSGGGARARGSRRRDAGVCRHRRRDRAARGWRPRRPSWSSARSASAIWTACSPTHLTPTISTPSAARAVQAAAARHKVRIACHLKIDTGMNRLGFRHDNIERTMPGVRRRRRAGDRRRLHPLRDRGQSRASGLFRTARSGSTKRARGWSSWVSRPRDRHAANSAALLRDERVWYDYVRPGLAALRDRAPAARGHAATATCPVTP